MRTLAIPSVLALGLLAACADPTVGPPPPRAAAPAAASFSKSESAPIAGQYIVRFRDDVQDVDGEAGRVAGKHGAKITRTYKAALKGMTVQLSDAAAAALAAEPSVLRVEQDQTMSISTTQTGATWGLDRVDQRALPLSGTYSYAVDGSGVTVYIIDTGINFTHTEYAGRAFTGVDEVTAGGTAADCNGHGSHVSGTVGGTTYGMAKNVKLVAVRVLDCAGSGSNSGVIAGIDWVTAQKRANPAVPSAANMSLGGGFSSTLNQAVENSIAAGVVYAIAAGNSAANACNSSPASAPSAITVGATSITDGFASFSNYGTCVKINAPGVNITSAWMGSTTATNTISGTSMATPHVAGAAALYLQVNPSAAPAAVRSALTGNATQNVITGVPAGTPNLLLYSAFITAGPSTAPPVANFTYSCTSLSCTFDGSSSTALATATYSWDFGDGTNGAGKQATHTYAKAGSYSVTLTVTDANGTSSKIATVTVTDAATAPVARFTTSCSGRLCSFDASTTTNATSYQWNFGDGTGGSGMTISHQFAPRKSYTVTLTASGSGGSSTATTTVTCNKNSCS